MRPGNSTSWLFVIELTAPSTARGLLTGAELFIPHRGEQAGDPLLNPFRLTQHPGPPIPDLEWSVEVEDHVPAFARNGLHPVVFL